MIHKILRLFLNTLTVNDKHYLLNRDNLTQRIKIQLCEKAETFSECFFAFLKCILNFKHLQKKKMTLFANIFLEIPVPKDMLRYMSKKPFFRGPLDRQQGKWVEKWLQSKYQHPCNIY